MIVAAAVRIGDLTVSMPRPNRHHHIIHAMFLGYGIRSGEHQGFLTDDGQFVDREVAAKMAIECGQVDPKNMTYDDVLFSEDLW